MENIGGRHHRLYSCTKTQRTKKKVAWRKKNEILHSGQIKTSFTCILHSFFSGWNSSAKIAEGFRFSFFFFFFLFSHHCTKMRWLQQHTMWNKALKFAILDIFLICYALFLNSYSPITRSSVLWITLMKIGCSIFFFLLSLSSSIIC